MSTTTQSTNDIYYLAMVLLGIISLLAVVVLMFFIRLNETKVAKPTCASFSSYGEAYTFLQNNPQYKSRLDRDHNGIPCQNDYGSNGLSFSPFNYGNI